MMAVWATRDMHRKVYQTNTSVEVKSYFSKTSIDVLMACLGLPALYRLHGFRSDLWMPGVTSRDGVHKAGGVPIDFDRSLLEDGSKMVWVGREVLDDETARKCAQKAVEHMLNRSDNATDYQRTA